MKHRSKELHQKLYETIIYAWGAEQRPKGWEEETTIKKKGDPEECIINKRLLTYTNNIIGNYEIGFTAGKSTVDAYT